MRWSKLFIPTLREPTLREAPVGIPSMGGRLLTRAGYIRGEAKLALGRRSLTKIERIIREELDSLGAQELHAPPKQSMTTLARELRSYKQLPQIWYQFRDGFEACSFRLTPVDFLETFRKIFRSCGVECLVAECAGGAKKFVVPCEAGEDPIVRGETYCADLASAVSSPRPLALPDPEGDLSPEPFHTPGRKTIAELADFTGLPETSHIKSLVLFADDLLVMAHYMGM